MVHINRNGKEALRAILPWMYRFRRDRSLPTQSARKYSVRSRESRLVVHKIFRTIPKAVERRRVVIMRRIYIEFRLKYIKKKKHKIIIYGTKETVRSVHLEGEGMDGRT